MGHAYLAGLNVRSAERPYKAAVRQGAGRVRVADMDYKQRYQNTKRRLGRQRGPKVAQIDLSRTLTEAVWRMLTRNQPFAGATCRLAP